MITIRRALEREHVALPESKAWHTFFTEDETAPLADGFGILVIVNELGMAPQRTGSMASSEGAEVVTYVLQGNIAYEDSVGASGVIHAGEFQRMDGKKRIRYRETSTPPSAWAHVFQIGLRSAPPAGASTSEQKRFTLAQRQGVLCTIASEGGHGASLHIRPDARLFSAVLDPGQHVAHALAPGRKAWLHLVFGKVSLGGTVLCTGDGAGIQGERAVSVTARDNSELLLIDLPEATTAQSNGLAPQYKTDTAQHHHRRHSCRRA
jgi:redox-sensitive bicupin YhaK (pirin superfamily)